MPPTGPQSPRAKRHAILFAVLGWDPTWEKQVPQRIKVLWTVAAVGLWTVVGGITVMAILHMPEGQWWRPMALLFLFSVLLSVIGVTIRSRLLEYLEFEADQIAARRIQADLLPSALPAVPGVDLAAHYSPYREVGGDYYDAFMLDASRLLVAVGDVSGKGTAAAMLSANAQALLHFALAGGQSLERAAEAINAHLDRHTDAARYLTMVLAVFDLETRRLTWVNAGHNPPMILTPDGQVFRLEGTGLPLGMMPASTYVSRSVALPTGSVALFYTDGVSERLDRSGNMFEDERLEALLRAPRGTTAHDLMTTVANAVEAFAGGTAPDDDTTLLVLRTP